MRVDSYIWKNSFKQFSENNRAVFKSIKNPSIGYSSDYLMCSVSINFRNNNLLVTQNGTGGSNEVVLSFLNIEYSYEKLNSLSLSINQRDFFDKLFSRKRIKMGMQMFDEKFTINSTDDSIAQRIFREERIQSLFLNNNLLILNIQTEKNITTIRLKSMEVKLYALEEMQSLVDDFKCILEKILL